MVLIDTPSSTAADLLEWYENPPTAKGPST
jgi:hypothetical protein